MHEATVLKNRESVLNLKPGDRVRHGQFEVEVSDVTCAMGGDVCIEGIVKSWLSSHPYDVAYGARVVWGPKYMVRGGLTEYITKKNVIERKKT